MDGATEVETRPDDPAAAPGTMKLLMIIVESEYAEELEVLMQRHQVMGFTEIPQVHGRGATGWRMGSRAFPKTSSLFFTVIPADSVEPLVQDIHTYCEACLKRMRMMVWGVEQVI